MILLFTMHHTEVAMSTAKGQNLEQFLDELRSIRIHHSKAAGPSLKKPLLVLLVIAMIENGTLKSNRIHFSNVEKALSDLIRKFGGRAKSGAENPDEPFSRLRTSSFWTLYLPGGLPAPEGGTVSQRDLRNPDSYASLRDDVYELLASSKDARERAAEVITSRWWSDPDATSLRARLAL